MKNASERTADKSITAPQAIPAEEKAADVSQAAMAQGQETAQEREGQACVVIAPHGLNLRRGPGISFPVLTVLEEGAPVTAFPLPYGVEVPDWALVRAGEVFGWTRREFLTPAEE